MLDNLIERCYNKTAKQYRKGPLYEGSWVCTPFWVHAYNNSYSSVFQVPKPNFISFVKLHNFGGRIMDITLKRILSLLSTNPDGSIKHGAKKEFAKSIGYDSGDIVSMWIKGSSKSYLNKLHEISVKYGVSVEWLKGETDEKKPSTPEDEGLDTLDMEALNLFRQLWPDNRKHLLEIAQSLLKAQEVTGGQSQKDF